MAGSLRRFAEYASQGIIPAVEIPERTEIQSSGENETTTSESNAAAGHDDTSSSDSDVPPTLLTKAKIMNKVIQQPDESDEDEDESNDAGSDDSSSDGSYDANGDDLGHDTSILNLGGKHEEVVTYQCKTNAKIQ
ncbi:hypothetical protein GN958_ATG23084 [Phytophthora infestans]|uniref:Uncharacterized protein n=1 Tax=Phytophthora infestans TaxID=4787 RepID=A0A8S9TP10_PHYIN|nr:hypothetical protein GN958_ATG23084 [Phytophthora infestans]